MNDCMEKGPDEMNQLQDVLLNFRSVESAIILDMEKAYQSIHTREKEKHLRRTVWRASPDLPWEDYAYEKVTFGDLAAGLLLKVAKTKVAEEGKGIDVMAAQQIKKNSYVDNCFLGGSLEDIDRMKGEELEAGGYGGTAAEILGTGGIRAKFMATTGDPRPEAATPLGGKVLGMGYKLAEYIFTLKVPLKFNMKGRGRQK